MRFKQLYNGFCVAFSLYSKIPMPQTEWTKETMQYALPFLPLVGVCIGILEWGLLHYSIQWNIGGMLYAALAMLLAFMISGGIHMDGFADTCDALCSYGDREKKLAILKDPHIGAFGVMHLVMLCIVQYSLFQTLYGQTQWGMLLGLGYVLARTIGGGIIVWVPSAKSSGLAYLFARESNRRVVSIAMALEMLVCIALSALVSVWIAMGVLICCLFGIWYYRAFCIRTFGGATGDLAGFAITCVETFMLALVVLLQFLGRGV